MLKKILSNEVAKLHSILQICQKYVESNHYTYTIKEILYLNNSYNVKIHIIEQNQNITYNIKHILK